MLTRVLTLRFGQRLEGFDDQPLRDFLAQREVLAVSEHFFQCNHVPNMAVMVTYALEPSSPNSTPRAAEQGRKGIDWRAQVAEADIPLYDALRDWRAERAARRRGALPDLHEPAARGDDQGPPAEHVEARYRRRDRQGQAGQVRSGNPRLARVAAGRARASDAPTIFVAWQDFLVWLLPTTAKLPKHVRFTLVNRIDNLALDIAEDLVEARYSRSKMPVLARANLRLEKLRILLRVCNVLGYLSHSAYEHASRRVNAVGAMLGGWRKQQAAR